MKTAIKRTELPVLRYSQEYAGWNYMNDKFVRYVFGKYCKLVEDEDHPDIYMENNVSIYNPVKYHDNTKPTIYFIGESQDFDKPMSVNSVTVGCNPKNDCVCNILFYMYMLKHNILDVIKHRHDTTPTKFACTTIGNHTNTDGARDTFIRELSNVIGLPVDNGNKVCGIGFENRYNWAKDYKFNICMENTSQPYYHTEKLLQACTSGIPVYYGAEDDWIWSIFNREAFVVYNGCNTNKVIEEIIALNNNKGLYLDKYKLPIFTTDAMNIIEKEINNFDKFIHTIVKLFAKY